MRATRNPIVHVLILAIIAAVAIVTVRTHQFGVNRGGPDGVVASSTASPKAPADETRTLQHAAALRQQGEYDSAIVALKTAVTSSNPDVASNALLETAKDQIALGDTQDAMANLKRLRARYGRAAATDDAQFHLGLLEAKRGELSSAIKDLGQYSARHPEISSYMSLLIARYQEGRGDLSAAFARASAVAASEAITRERVDALELMRDIDAQRHDDRAYLDETNRLLALAVVPSYRAELTYERAGAELRLHQPAAAQDDLRTVVSEYPDSGYASNANNDLRKLAGQEAVGPEQEGLVDYYAGKYQAVLEDFTAALGSNPSSDAAWYYRAMARLKNGDDATALYEMKLMADRFPASALTPRALVTAGRLSEETGELKTARAIYQRLLESYPRSAEATTARLRLGIMFYEQADFGGAVSQLSPITGPGSERAEASFWEGKAFQRLGDTERATRAFTDASEADPTGFYGLRAGELLRGTNAVVSGALGTSIDATLSAADQDASRAWFAARGTTVDEARAVVRQNAGYQRMILLYRLGLTTQADWEMSALADQLSISPATLAELGQLLSESGEFNAGYRVGLRLQKVAGDSGIGLPVALQRLAYPLAFPALVQTQSSAHTLDPYAFLALVRQESGYDPSVTSAAGARGLAQILPSTASGLAKSLRIGNYQADMLYRPAIAIQLGTLYLSDSLNKYQGAFFSALAAYNAGDGNVDQWLTDTLKTDPDLFVERIPFPETQDYVEQVYANYLNYKRLYP